jgi:hypothetical protein
MLIKNQNNQDIFYSLLGNLIVPLTYASINSIKVLLNEPLRLLYRSFAISRNLFSTSSDKVGWKYIFAKITPPLDNVIVLHYIKFFPLYLLYCIYVLYIQYIQ